LREGNSHTKTSGKGGGDSRRRRSSTFQGGRKEGREEKKKVPSKERSNAKGREKREFLLSIPWRCVMGGGKGKKSYKKRTKR